MHIEQDHVHPWIIECEIPPHIGACPAFWAPADQYTLPTIAAPFFLTEHVATATVGRGVLTKDCVPQ
jgi:hypothetical protein